ncbi:MAG: hypothetical protein SGI73_08985 [Chloroflexota bacterium]|nr:hypothetical protein [Chloroflexota bacterium]
MSQKTLVLIITSLMLAVSSGALVFSQEGTSSEGQPAATATLALLPEIPIAATTAPTLTPFIDAEGSMYEDGGQIVTRQPPIIPADSEAPITFNPSYTPIISDGSFSLPIGSKWQAYSTGPGSDQPPYPLYINAEIYNESPTNSILRFHRLPNANSAVILQPTTVDIPAQRNLQIGIWMANKHPTLYKRVTIVAHDYNFQEQVACVFWLEPNMTSRQPYSILASTIIGWNDATLSIYEASTDGGGWIELDNAAMFYDTNPGASFLRSTDCREQNMLVEHVGAMGRNLVRNPTFLSPQTSGDRWSFNGINTNIGFGTLWLTPAATLPYAGGQAFNNTGVTIPINTVLTLHFNAANMGSTRKRISIILNDSTWPTTSPSIRFCSFWLEPDSLMRSYRIWTHTDAQWNAVQVSIYDSTSGPGTLKFDNFHLRTGGSLGSYGTICRFNPPPFIDPVLSYRYQMLSSTTGSWSLTETAQVQRGIEQVASAVFNLSAQPTSTDGVWNSTIAAGTQSDTILFVRANNAQTSTSNPIPDVEFTYTNVQGNAVTITYNDVNHGNCKAFPGDATFPKAIICNGRDATQPNPNLIVNEYTTVHELGHIVDYRSGYALRNSMGGNVSVDSCPTNPANINTRYVVFGLLNGFQRGSRGWGSSPHTNGVPTNFQQSPVNDITEASADMFLNWVYRFNSLDNSTPITSVPTNNGLPIGCPTGVFPEPWSGFLNRDWLNPGAGFDPGMPGEVRYAFMNQVMRSIFP